MRLKLMANKQLSFMEEETTIFILLIRSVLSLSSYMYMNMSCESYNTHMCFKISNLIILQNRLHLKGEPLVTFVLHYKKMIKNISIS